MQISAVFIIFHKLYCCSEASEAMNAGTDRRVLHLTEQVPTGTSYAFSLLLKRTPAFVTLHVPWLHS